MPDLVFADLSSAVNKLSERVATEVEALVAEIDDTSSSAELERAIVRLALSWGREALSTAWSEQCRQATEADVRRRELDTRHVTLRSDPGSTWTMMSTLGPVPVANFAYRDRSVGIATVTRVPAREVFPMHRRCRSSELCLQWECRLGIEQPFRSAQASLAFFTHDAVSLEDTTIARHMVAVGQMIDTRWLYRRPADIRDILEQRATRDRKSGRPLLYVSSDAHSLRRYVDDGWQPAWKNANGIRLWCIDQQSEAIIHLGGEYTFGDCHVVGQAIDRLSEIGVLPSDGDYGDGLVAQYVLVTDGAAWLVDHVYSRLDGAVAILDAYHVMEYLALHAAVLYVQGTAAAKRLYQQMVTALFGPKPRRRRKSEKRKGHTKRKRGDRRVVRVAPAHDPSFGISKLLGLLRNHQPPKPLDDAHAEFIAKIERNQWRMDYPALRARGIQIGSGAMESLHRNASQLRLKRPGAKWCVETAEAILNLRMLGLADRWDEFWNRPDQKSRITAAFDAQAQLAMAGSVPG